LTAFPFVFVKYRADKENIVFINHENTLTPAVGIILPFLYGNPRLYCSIGQYKTRIWPTGILVLNEAYSNESDMGYLKSRSILRFIKYLALSKTSFTQKSALKGFYFMLCDLSFFFDV
jgi:hypothetical protein